MISTARASADAIFSKLHIWCFPSEVGPRDQHRKNLSCLVAWPTLDQWLPSSCCFLPFSWHWPLWPSALRPSSLVADLRQPALCEAPHEQQCQRRWSYRLPWPLLWRFPLLAGGPTSCWWLCPAPSSSSSTCNLRSASTKSRWARSERPWVFDGADCGDVGCFTNQFQKLWHKNPRALSTEGKAGVQQNAVSELLNGWTGLFDIFRFCICLDLVLIKITMI